MEVYVATPSDIPTVPFGIYCLTGRWIVVISKYIVISVKLKFKYYCFIYWIGRNYKELDINLWISNVTGFLNVEPSSSEKPNQKYVIFCAKNIFNSKYIKISIIGYYKE